MRQSATALGPFTTTQSVTQLGGAMRGASTAHDPARVKPLHNLASLELTLAMGWASMPDASSQPLL